MNKKVKKILNKKNKSKIICLTAYSKNVASILDKHCDLVLVGDSLGSVLYNYKSTKEVTLDIMIRHSKSVRLGVNKSLMVVDMPYNTYRNPNEALKNAKLIMKKTDTLASKLPCVIKRLPMPPCRELPHPDTRRSGDRADGRTGGRAWQESVLLSFDNIVWT